MRSILVKREALKKLLDQRSAERRCLSATTSTDGHLAGSRFELGTRCRTPSNKLRLCRSSQEGFSLNSSGSDDRLDQRLSSINKLPYYLGSSFCAKVDPFPRQMFEGHGGPWAIIAAVMSCAHFFEQSASFVCRIAVSLLDPAAGLTSHACRTLVQRLGGFAQ